MMTYKKYILKLLFSRFFVLSFCIVIFGIFQEITRAQLISMCSFWQMMLILPLMTPMTLFLFLPFIYSGTLLLVLNKLYSDNELISIKAIGISDMKIFKIFLYFLMFILLFFVFLGLIYPATNKLFFKQRNIFVGNNILKTLKKNKINRLGKYEIFFSDIENNSELKNVNIVINNNQEEKQQNKKKIVFSKTVLLQYNKFDELIAYCKNNDILTIDFKNKTQQKDDGIFLDSKTFKQDDKQMAVSTKQLIHADEIVLLLDDFFQFKNSYDVRYKQKLRQLGFLTLLKTNSLNSYEEKIKKLEIHGRAVVYWFVLTTITFLCCILLKRKTNRFPSFKITSLIIVVSSAMAISRAFALEFMVKNDILFFYYMHFIVVCFVCFFFLKRNKI